MDRRDFLKVSGAAAATAAVGASQSTAEQSTHKTDALTGAPHVSSALRELVLVTPWEVDLAGFGASAARLARRIEIASGGRYRIAVDHNAAEALTVGDLAFGCPHENASLHPAFAFFGGLPCGQGLDAQAFQAWITTGGGEMLWDDLAAGFGMKPLLAGHTGPSAGLWSNRRLETAASLARLKVFAVGLAADVLRRVGAEPVSVAGHELKASLGGGLIHAAEWLGPMAAVASDLTPLAERLYRPGLNVYGVALSLNVNRRLWEAMNEADQALFAACAAEEWRLALAEARAHAAIATQVAGPRSSRVILPPEAVTAFADAASEVVQQLADGDPISGRIWDSYRAFRRFLLDGESGGDPRTA
jgi:TRAP-type mannitol/chloroaromatic compound transport system substrate-binding protein